MMSSVDLDPVIHSPNRLQICALLSPLDRAEFRTLREELGVSESVLSKHLSELEGAGYVRLKKDVIEGRRRTWASLTRAGRRAFASHVQAIQRLVSLSEQSS